MKRIIFIFLFIFCNAILQMRAHFSTQLHNGIKLYRSGNVNSALKIFEQLNEEYPQVADILFMLGHAYYRKFEFQKSYNYFIAALERKPFDTKTMYSLSNACLELGKFEEAKQLLELLIGIDPKDKKAQKKLAYEYIRSMEFDKATSVYPFNNVKTQQYSLPQKRLLNKSVFIQHDGGYGDSIQFIRYAKLLHDLGAHVTVQAPSGLIPLYSLCGYINEIISLNDPKPHTDFSYRISTPHLTLGLQKELLKNSLISPYLAADEKLITLWKEKLNNDHTFKIGLCWHTSFAELDGKVIVSPRTVPAEKLAPLSQLKNVHYYCLQKFMPTDPVEMISIPEFLIHFNSDFDQTHGRFMDTAAVMKNMDLIITVDTSIAHLAGALAVPVWVMLPAHSDPRWFSDRDDSPWYPTMRLFRSKKYNDWDAVIQNIITELKKIIPVA